MLDTELDRAILYLIQPQRLLSVSCTSYKLKKIEKVVCLKFNIDLNFPTLIFF